ncbi:ABC transporter ATP-binding protein [Cellulomonas algicola]|uniref:ABC transporter ATP-binding protein n=1 Tax=Cellulomonas algicola TaxID=2071633 RepID=UPI001C3F8283|nr:ABC transporter ATP-binding protein [Cellulomonas algicola]
MTLPATPDIRPADPGAPDTPVLQAVDLRKHFVTGSFRRRALVHAVDDVNLALHRGRVVALVGESGSGKSTIARLLSQLTPATSGQILLHGQDATARSRRAFRRYVRRVQMIFQDPFGSLNPVHTVRYTLTRSVRIHQGRLRGADLEDALTTLLERVQLTPVERYVDKFPHELSGGQRQRVAIARALAADPEVLLADEPISMLDVSIRLGILNLLRDLRDRLQIAILYITHDIASARYFADRTMVMYAGRIVETGDSESVTQDPKHPYTQLLVRSAPDPDDLDARARGARGEAPSLVRPPTGCRFNPRCPFAVDLCRTEVPPLLAVGEGREAACWGYSDRPDRPRLGDVLDAYGERPPIDVDLLHVGEDEAQAETVAVENLPVETLKSKEGDR